MPFRVEEYEFLAPSFVREVRLSTRCFFNSLIVDWPDFLVRHRFASLHFRMPDRITITCAQARLLQSLLNERHSVLFYVRDYRDHISLLPLAHTVWELQAASRAFVHLAPNNPPLYPRLDDITRL
jgi:hypothetical protein